MTGDKESDAVLEEFEAAWRTDSPPDISAYFQKENAAASESLRVALLELDLEYRWKRFGKDLTAPSSSKVPALPSVADYCDAMSVELSPANVVELIVLEFHLREKWADKISVDNLIQCNRSVLNDDRADMLHARLQQTVAPSVQCAGEVLHAKQIGPYKILQKIAAGGMGAVFVADQQEPIRRRVALKLIKGGTHSDQIIARFEAERQALAMMDHPNIARILDAGTTEDGSPYFVMELVSGIPITEYCDRNKLSVRERLELLIPVCAAVQHAHQKGIIHRDLKPSNILVAESDGLPIPKVIDFGLAKSLEPVHRLTDKTLFTEFGSVLGTLQYMSPEQAEFNHLDVDTRTDIYALGAVLYELLTGSPPIDRETLKNHALLQALKLIKEHEPVSPSERISDTTLTAPGVSQQRRIAAPGRLQQMLQGELDWIVMRAIERDRSRRYDSVGSLREDVGRYLANEPVAARPPGQIYLFRKFISRHWKTLTASLVVLGLTVAAIVSYSIWSEREKHNQIQLNQANARAARSDYRSAINFHNAGRIAQFTEQLGRMPEQHRHIEWRLARNTKMGKIAGRHEHAALTVAVSEDGRFFASAGTDGQIAVRDVATLKLIARISAPHEKEAVYALAFKPGQPQTIASGGGDGFIRLWDITTENKIKELHVSEYDVRCIDFSSDGSRLLAAGGEKIAKKDTHPYGWVAIYNSDTLASETTFEEHNDCIYAARFSPDNSLVVSGGRDLKLHVWDADTGQLQQTFPASSYVWDVAWHPGGRTFASGTEDNFLTLHELESDRPHLWRRTGPSVVVYSVAFSDDGNQIATSAYNGTIKLWDTDTGEGTRTLHGHSSLVPAVEYIPEQNALVSASHDPDQTVRLWDLANGPETMTVTAHTQSVNAIAFSPNSRFLASVSGTHEREPYRYRKNIQIDYSVRVWDVDSGELAGEHIQHTNTVTDVEFHPAYSDGDRVVTCSLDGTIRIWDRSTGSERLKIDAGEGICAIRFDSTGTVLASVGETGVLKFWDVSDGRLQTSIPVDETTRLTCLDFSPDNQSVAVGTRSGELVHVEVSSKLINWQSKAGNEVYAVSFSPDGKQIYSGNGGTSLTLAEADTGEILRTFSNHNFSVYSIDFHSEDGTTRMLTGSHNGDWKLWDPNGMEELRSIRPFSNEIWVHIFDAKISPDGQQIAIACSDGIIRFWDCSDTADRRNESVVKK